MALSIQNIKFLTLLHDLGVGLTYVSDKTFDGLFENIPEPMNYFFNWFLENITEDNVLTDSEDAMYFEIIKKNEENINNLMPKPETYEELHYLDSTHVNNILPEELKKLEKSYSILNDIYFNLESNFDEVKKRNVSLTEILNVSKKKLHSSICDTKSALSSVVNKFEEVKENLLKEPDIELNLDTYINLFINESKIFMKQKNSLFFYDIISSSNYNNLEKLEENLGCINYFYILSQGSLCEKKIRLETLSDLLQNSNSFNISNVNVVTIKEISAKVTESILNLEKELKEKIFSLSHNKILLLERKYFLMKKDLYLNQLNNLNQCKEYVKYNEAVNLWILHFLKKILKSIENQMNTRKELQNILNEKERDYNVNVANFKMTKSRFSSISTRTNQHPLLLAVQNILNENNSINNDVCLENVNELLSHASDDFNFVTCDARTGMKKFIKSILDCKLRGPTSQLQFVPVNLYLKFLSSDERKKELLHNIKRIVNKYVEAKESISKTNRKKLLSWIDFISDSDGLTIKVENLERSANRSRLCMSFLKE